MSLFHYKAYDAAGATINGALEADSLATLEGRLRATGFWLLEAREHGDHAREEKIRISRAKASSRDQIAFFIQMTLLLQAGITLPTALAQLAQLGEAVLELLKAKKPFTRENLEATYVTRRRASWLETELRKAEHARNGFQKGFVRGLIGTALAGLSGGRLHLGGEIRRPADHVPTFEDYYRGRIDSAEIAAIRADCEAKGIALHDALMTRVGWPEIPLDGQLLVSQQDALLMGGKVQAPGGYADHLSFYDTATCEACSVRICVEACSGQAIMTNPEGGIPLFDREKCVHCGACLWNCSHTHPTDPERGNVNLQASTGGFHSAEN